MSRWPGSSGSPYGQVPACGGTVELLPGVGIGEPEVGAAVDHHCFRVELLGQLRRSAVRQCEENHVETSQRARRRVGDDSVGQRGQLRLMLTEPGTGTRACGDRADRHQGMAEEQPKQLAPGVPGGASHTHGEGHAA